MLTSHDVTSPHPEPWVSEIGVSVSDVSPVISEFESSSTPFTVVPPLGPSDLEGGVKTKIYGSVNLAFNALPPAPPLPPGNVLAYDHIVGNVNCMSTTASFLRSVAWPSSCLGPLLDFASFTAAEVGTTNSGLNSVVLRPSPPGQTSGVLLPLNEPVDGEVTKSQVTTYLERNAGEGVQHLAIRCADVLSHVEELRGKGVEFVDGPGEGYYEVVWEEKARGRIEEGEYERMTRSGVLVDVENMGEDDEGILLQIFTKPLGDEPTLFLEFIERRGCGSGSRGAGEEAGEGEGELVVGCGGFGKGNFRALFEGIEREERRRGLVK